MDSQEDLQMFKYEHEITRFVQRAVGAGKDAMQGNVPSVVSTDKVRQLCLVANFDQKFCSDNLQASSKMITRYSFSIVLIHINRFELH